MLSYRHAFHAGNHADVLKHIALSAMLEHLRKKDKPLLMVDTHAGGGLYRLDSEPAQKLAEFQDGIGRIWQTEVRTDSLPRAVEAYLTAVQALNPAGKLRQYPGSPWFFRRALRASDTARFFELHPNEYKLLKANLSANKDGKLIVARDDGLNALKSLLPPPSRRALVLIDPSYEVRAEYGAVENALREAVKRFATGVYAVWYPEIDLLEAREFLPRLKKLAGNASPREIPWLAATLKVRSAGQGGFSGMRGSGLFVLNPPWPLMEALQEALPWLAARLGQDEGADSSLTSG
ncbi:MAG: 23S rRNA (adenine(2030)-N(6))-methyltransferase RlmJ [Zoogloeaceae bacterium]|jgi:23S rRNA (adenine2030-N6)-methyltransferase|nr:23S rRNA (adenine(2030)-N(6))-methyltransferase RlmJ [Zoogloeaceae bacterium]